MVGEVIADRYELEELVGTGGMSSVYRAHDRLLERKVALKILHDYYGADAETIERFRREARAVAQLSHPNIVTVIDRGDDGGRQFIVFEYVDGENLKDVVVREGRLPVRRALELAVEVGRALAFAHHHGLVHRDVKPQNVLLNGDGTPKVTDFGIARSLDVDGVTQTGTVLGTSNYIAPEQASGRPVDAHTDVYSLGVVLYELLTGELPYAGESFVAVAMRHVNDPVPSVLERRPDVPVRVAGAVERAMAKEPRQRFASMDDLVDELETCLAELGPDADRDATMIAPSRVVRESAPRRTRARRRSAWPVALLAAGLVALAAVAVAGLLGAGPGGPSEAEGEEAPAGGAVALVGVGAHDPHGDDNWEHDDRAANATDGDAETYWTTQTYRAGLQKPGVGLVLDAGSAVELRSLRLATPTPGFTAEIQAGDGPGGPFRTVSPPQRAAAATTFPIEGEAARYYVVWITELGGEAAARARITSVQAVRR